MEDLYGSTAVPDYVNKLLAESSKKALQASAGAQVLPVYRQG